MSKHLNCLPLKTSGNSMYFYENSSEELADNEYEGFITKDFLEKRSFDLSSNFYICGPSAFMAMMKKHLLELGVDPTKIFIEFFGPLETL